MSADLDNFFARKDKRKQGKKIKEGLKIEVVPDTDDFDNYTNEKGSEFAFNETGYSKKEDSDSEWIEENPIEVDFTNLNIQNIDLNELNALIEKKLELDKGPDILIDADGDHDAMPENTDEVDNNENVTGWKINESKKKTKEIIEIVDPIPQKKNVFIPPHLRKEMEKKKSKHFVNNEEEFPSLLK